MKIVILITVIESFAVMSVAIYFHYRRSQSRKRVLVSRRRMSLLTSSKGGIKMTGIVEVSSNVPNHTRPAEWPGIVSRFQLVILAAHRSKQLLLGAQPRIVADRLKRRNTSIALEELKRGLILFKPVAVEEAQSMA